MTSFADLTTIGVGGHIARFIEPTSRVGVIEAVEDADSKGLPLCVIGGGSNLLVADGPFNGVVVRDAAGRSPCPTRPRRSRTASESCTSTPKRLQLG